MTGHGGAHEPVLRAAVVELLQVQRGGGYVDATAGMGGHTVALLEVGADRVLAIDTDPAAVRALRNRFAADPRVMVRHGNFRALAELVALHAFRPVDGVLFDLGVSSPQLDEPARGFSFRHDASLDMRLDPTTGRTAAELVNTLSEQELADVLFQFGEERLARRLARRIVQRRPLRTTGELVRAVASATHGRTRIHPATRTFQALRIATNDELRALSEGLDGARAVIAPGGLIVAIAFHSLEDRIVKQRFRAWAAAGDGAILTKKPWRPSAEEVAQNPRARSARLRAIRWAE
ncbi:MAG: 16S rRNA (cytosine(1402)-N(4))-methyltransferase RsmH [Actinobacteria bacterium]|nr:16S rRNA (cytosine(1402)-N(4))-methyltransferase RsmH [Actinomycetota bacterium]